MKCVSLYFYPCATLFSILLVGSELLRGRDFSKDTFINAECEYWVTGQHNLGFYTGLADSSFDLIGFKTVYYVLILLSHNGNGACNNHVDIKDVGVHSYI